MDRLRLMLAGPRGLTLLACLALLAVVSAATVVSTAALTSTNRGQSLAVGAGSIAVTNPGDGSTILDVEDLHPGQSQCGTVTLTNESRLNAPVALSVENVGTSAAPTESALPHALRLTIDDVTSGHEMIWAGSMDDLAAQSLGTLATGETRRYRVTISFPTSSGVPALQNAHTSMRLRILEVSQ